jgi:hypothetical protein
MRDGTTDPTLLETAMRTRFDLTIDVDQFDATVVFGCPALIAAAAKVVVFASRAEHGVLEISDWYVDDVADLHVYADPDYSGETMGEPLDARIVDAVLERAHQATVSELMAGRGERGTGRNVLVSLIAEEMQEEIEEAAGVEVANI